MNAEPYFHALAIASGTGKTSIMRNDNALRVALQSINPRLVNSQIPGVAERIQRGLDAIPEIGVLLFGWWR